MEINKLKIFLTKLYYSIKGFLIVYRSKTKNFKVENYSTSIKNITYSHIEGRNFNVHTEAMEPSTGVVYFETKHEKIPYWVIGVLDFKPFLKDCEKIKINKEEITYGKFK